MLQSMIYNLEKIEGGGGNYMYAIKDMIHINIFYHYRFDLHLPVFDGEVYYMFLFILETQAGN